MKNTINYFYNMNINNIRMINDNYYFLYKNNYFIFQNIDELNFDIKVIFELNQILVNNNKAFFKIILNKNNQIITRYNNNNYIMMLDMVKQDRVLNFEDLLNNNIEIGDITNIKELVHFPWIDLWIKKIDYFELFLTNNMQTYQQLNKYANYFIGLGENAISYLRRTLTDTNPTNKDKLVVSHRRIRKNMSLKDLYNPLNLILDHKSRDISEYLKMLFFNKKYNDNDLKMYIEQLNLSNYGAKLLMARILFPSFFFDNFELLVKNKITETTFLKIIDQINAYEHFIYLIHRLLKEKYDIYDIDWLKKIDYSSTLTTPRTSGTSFINIDSMPSFSVTSIMLQ